MLNLARSTGRNTALCWMRVARSTLSLIIVPVNERIIDLSEVNNDKVFFLQKLCLNYILTNYVDYNMVIFLCLTGSYQEKLRRFLIEYVSQGSKV